MPGLWKSLDRRVSLGAELVSIQLVAVGTALWFLHLNRPALGTALYAVSVAGSALLYAMDARDAREAEAARRRQTDAEIIRVLASIDARLAEANARTNRPEHGRRRPAA